MGCLSFRFLDKGNVVLLADGADIIGRRLVFLCGFQMLKHQRDVLQLPQFLQPLTFDLAPWTSSPFTFDL